MHSGTAFQDFWFTIKLVGLTEVHQHSRTEEQLVHMSKRPRSPGGRCHHFRKFCEMKQSKMETRKQPWAPTPPCKRVNGRAHPVVQAERDSNLAAWTQKRGPCPSLTLVALWHLHCQYHCLINRRFLPHRLYPASPNTLLYLKLSQDKNRGRLSSWRSIKGKHHLMGARGRGSVLSGTPFYTPPPLPQLGKITGEGQRGCKSWGMMRAMEGEVLHWHGGHIHECIEAMVTCKSPGWAKSSQNSSTDGRGVLQASPPIPYWGATSV